MFISIRSTLSVVSILAILGTSNCAWSQQPTINAPATDKATAPDTTVPSDQYSWSGDVLVFHADFPGIMGESGKEYCVPYHSRFLVSDEDKTTHKLTGRFDSIGSDKEKRYACEQGSPINSYTTYYLDKAKIEHQPHSRRGWTFGALIVPFKYQTSDKSFGGSTTIGPYVGYRIANFGGFFNGTSTTLVASAGWVNNIAVPTAPGVTPAGSVNRSGFSLAGGVIFSVDKGTGIQAGLLIGQDRLGSNAIAPYAYEGKTWVSMAIGYKFF